MHIVSHLKSKAPRQLAILLLATLLCSLTVPASAAKLYKWVDENGEVRYSDRPPVKQTSDGHQQLNSQGVVLNTTEAAKSAEELATEAEEAAKLQEEARIQEIQNKQDRVLTMTFASAEEIEMARDNRIEVIDSVIRLIESSLETTQKKLDDINKSAELSYTSKGKDIPGGVAQKIEFFEHKVESRNAQLQAKVNEKEKIREKYQLDLERFLVLTSASN